MSKKTKNLEPYSKNGMPKYKESDFVNGRKSISRARQQAIDANRCLKKSKRQELKIDLLKMLEDE
jgi:hypothetical protein